MSTVVDRPALPPEAEASQLVLRLCTGYFVSAAMNVALELRIADKVAAGPRSAADLAKESGVNEDALYRVLRLLASHGVFEESAPRTFTATLPSEMMRSDSPGTPYAMARFISDAKHLQINAELMESVKTGRPAAEKVLGAPVFEYLARDAAWSDVFNNAMTAFSAQVIPAALEAYDFGDIGVLVDIAGGHGEVLIQALKRHPRMRGVLFDLEHVIAGAPPRFAAAGVQDRVDAVSGDFFTDVPRGGDAYIMKHIIHDWDDEHAGVILKNIHRALAGESGGRVILLESVVQPGNQPDFAKLIDIEMLTLPGGRERTAEEFAALFARSGFELARIVPTQSPLSVIEARPR